MESLSSGRSAESGEWDALRSKKETLKNGDRNGLDMWYHTINCASLG